MEVLEYVETIDFPKVLHEIRRVCRGTLIVTVRHDEPEPPAHEGDQGGAGGTSPRQRFSEDKIERWFPRAERELVPRGERMCPWMMLVERPAR